MKIYLKNWKKKYCFISLKIFKNTSKSIDYEQKKQADKVTCMPVFYLIFWKLILIKYTRISY